MLTALDDEGNQLKGLDLQADDSVLKFCLCVSAVPAVFQTRGALNQCFLPLYKPCTPLNPSVKVFLLTLLLIAVCCFTTYSFILQAAPKNYQYDIEDADLELQFSQYFKLAGC